MREVTSSELYVLVNELKPKVEHGFFRKFYDLGDGAFRIAVYREGESTTIYFKLLLAFNETQFAEEAGAATNFAMGIRKRIENAKVMKLYQSDSDRIVVFEMRGREKDYKLIIEMFGKGNVVLVNQEGEIELCYKSIQYRERTVAPRSKYVLPKGSSIEIAAMEGEIVLGVLNEEKERVSRIISELTKRVNIGPLYLEDILNRCGIDPKATSMSETEKRRLADALEQFSMRMADPDPLIYNESGKFVDYAITPIKKYEGMEKLNYDTLGGVLDEVYSEGRFSINSEKEEKAAEELNSNIGKQKELAEQTMEEAKRCADSANRIFENMNAINALIFYINEKKKVSIEELRKEFGEMRIKEIDPKNKTVKIEL